MTHKLNPSLATTGDQAHPSLSPFGRLFIGLLILVGQPSVFLNPFLRFSSRKKLAEVANPGQPLVRQAIYR
jgi:hypothetical protein